MPDVEIDRAAQTIVDLKRINELEKDREQLRKNCKLEEMKRCVAEKKLDDIEGHLSSVVPRKPGAATQADRVKQLVDRVEELRRENSVLVDMRRGRDEQRKRWEHVADIATAAVSITVEDSGAKAKAVAEYADCLVDEGESRFGKLLSPVDAVEPSEAGLADALVEDVD